MNIASIKISHIGPIKRAEFDLNRVNVLMGEQSSGKSTIAKIISYCQWVEKRSLLDGENSYDFKEQFIEFHRIEENYFNGNSYFEYKTKSISISWSYREESDKVTIKKRNENLDYLKPKNIYIPAERNFVSVIPNLSRFKETNDNIMSFLYDWYDIKKQYLKENPLEILSLGIGYYHIENGDLDMLMLVEQEKEIFLRNASSGLQSVIPLIMIVDYLTNGFYKKKKLPSVNEKKYISSLVLQLMMGHVDKNDSNSNRSSKNDIILDLIEDRIDYHHSNFIIEEPEQNLFPETQKELVYYLLSKINDSKRSHTMTITTHSPYILYALNNCIMASLTQNSLSRADKNKLDCLSSKIDPSLISIFQIEDGEIESIQEEDGLIGKNFFDAKMQEVMNEFYIMLNRYECE